jgi:hypothetical protein
MVLWLVAAAFQAPHAAAAIAAATLPLPPEARAGATVVTMSVDGHPDTLRAGTNPMVCFTDAPADTLLDVRCYHATFAPLIYAARSLYRAGLSDSAVDARMAAQIRSGALPTPPFPTAGYRVLGPLRGYDPRTGALDASMDRWQSVHMPLATTSGVGVGDVERGTEPYMMAAGTWWAHVMIMQQPLRY